MATAVPPKKNTAYVFYTGLVSQADTKLLKAAPTLAAGDAKVSIDGAAFANLATLPAVTPAAGTAVKISLSAAEMNGDNIVVTMIDAAGAEWCDQLIELQTVDRWINDLAYPATSGRSMVVDAAGLVDANAVKAGASGAGVAWASGAIVAGTFAAGAVDAAALSADAGNEIADAVLSRNVSNVEATAGEHTLCTVILGTLESSTTATTWTIKRTDGSTTHASKPITTDATANPVTAIT